MALPARRADQAIDRGGVRGAPASFFVQADAETSATTSPGQSDVDVTVTTTTTTTASPATPEDSFTCAR